MVYIIADGVPADVMEREDIPNFQKIITAGSYSQMHVDGDEGTYC